MNPRRFSIARWLAAAFGLSLALTLNLSSPVYAQAPTCAQMVEEYATFTACYGTLADGNNYGFEVPADWNGTLVLISQGYTSPDTPLPTSASLPPETSSGSWILNLFHGPVPEWLLGNRFAVATSWGGFGWSVHESLHEQIETLDIFTSTYGSPDRTIAYGVSLGGLTTAGLVQQHPERFQGALALSGLGAGGVGSWNQILDFAFVVKRLLGPQSLLRVVQITNPGTPTSGNWGLARQLLGAAQHTPAGRARIALACAMNDVPGWIDPTSAEPAPGDYGTQEFNQFLWASEVLAGFAFGDGRADLEARAGGNPTWNTGVSYGVQLENSIDYAEVVALYQAAGLSLDNDLARLRDAPRIAADPASVEYLRESIDLNGDLGGVPVLTVHGTGDGLAVVEGEAAYRWATRKAQDSQLLRQAFVHRGGHAGYTLAEIVAAFQALLQRVDTGRWQAVTNPEALNAAALALGPSYNMFDVGGGNLIPMDPAYEEYEPAPFLRSAELDAEAPPLEGGTLSQPVDTPDPDQGSSVAAQSLSAWPLPYRGGSLQVSLSPGMSAATNVRVGIYNLSGRLVRLLSGTSRNGSGALAWDGRDADGAAVGNGIYFLRATGGGRGEQLKLVVIR